MSFIQTNTVFLEYHFGLCNPSEEKADGFLAIKKRSSRKNKDYMIFIDECFKKMGLIFFFFFTVRHKVNKS